MFAAFLKHSVVLAQVWERVKVESYRAPNGVNTMGTSVMRSLRAHLRGVLERICVASWSAQNFVFRRIQGLLPTGAPY